MEVEKSLFPIFESILTKTEKENLLSQKGIVIWMVGLSGSGKSTVAKSIERNLHEKGFLTQMLDGDNLRSGINSDLGFSEADRIENIRRSAEIAKLFLNCGVITICPLISPTEKIRQIVRNIIGEEDLLEVFINCPLEECEKRDVKGLYKRARRGELKNFTGIDFPFEAPKSVDVELKTDKYTVDECTDKLLHAIYQRIDIRGERVGSVLARREFF